MQEIATDSAMDLGNKLYGSEFYNEFFKSSHAPLIENHKRGDFLFWEGDRANSLVFLVDGFVKMVKYGSEGKTTIVGVHGPGEILGEESVIDGAPYNITAVAMTAVTVAKRPMHSSRSMLHSDPEFIRRMALKLSSKLRDVQDTIQGIATTRVEKRIASLLVKLATQQSCADACRLELPLTRQEVAEMVGATVETTIRIFSQFIQDGAIGRGGRKLEIKNLEYLRRIAESED